MDYRTIRGWTVWMRRQSGEADDATSPEGAWESPES
jgi:hypothetical protein